MRAFLLFFAISVGIYLFAAPDARAATPADFGLVEGDIISAEGDPDIFIINKHGYKRLFLNPAIFGFYGHLKWQNVRRVSATTRDAFSTSGLFRNCEANDPKVYGVQVTAEDNGQLHWVNISGEQAALEDPNFFQKTFCVNSQEFLWYSKGISFSSTFQVPQYVRSLVAAFPAESASLGGLEFKKRSEHFTMYFHAGDEALAEAFLNFSEQDYRTLRSIFMNDAQTEILIAQSADEYIDVFQASPPWQRDTLRNATSSAGSFCPGCLIGSDPDSAYVYALRPQASSNAHEYAHRFWWATYQNLRRKDNLHWLNEGLAGFTQHEVSREPAPGGFNGNTFQKIIEKRQTQGSAGAPANYSLMNDLLRTSDSAIAANWHDYNTLFVYYMESRLDDYGLARFMRDLNTTQDIEQTFMNMFGFTGAQVYTFFKQTLDTTAAISTEKNFLDVFLQNSTS